MESLGFENYKLSLEIYLDQYRKVIHSVSFVGFSFLTDGRRPSENPQIIDMLDLSLVLRHRPQFAPAIL